MSPKLSSFAILHYLKRDSFILSGFTEGVGQKKNIIHTNTKSKKWQNLPQKQRMLALDT